MTVEIIIKKVVSCNGECIYKVEKVTGCFSKSELPDEYLNGDHFYGLDGVVCISYGDRCLTLIPKKCYRVDEFNTYIKIMRKCGDRLMEIRKTAKMRTWYGSETISI